MSVDEERFSIHLFQYFHEGSWWTLEIPATSQEDAEARLNKLPHAQYLGGNAQKIPAALGWTAGLLCWARNLRSAWFRGRNPIRRRAQSRWECKRWFPGSSGAAGADFLPREDSS